MTELNLPAHLQSRMARGIAAQLAISLPSGTVPYLSIKGGRFTLYDAAGNEKSVGAMDPQLGVYLDVNIVDSNPHVSKIYYAGAYDPNAETSLPPDCWSDNGVAPSSQAARPQHQHCKTCPHNQWGSGTSRLTGKATKECNDVQKVAIAIPGMGDMVFLLRVPPASLKHLGKYVQELGSFSAGGRKVDISDLLTRVYFHKDAVGVLGFTAAAFVDEATAKVADKAYESKASGVIVGKNDQPYTGAIGVLPAAVPAEQRTLAPPPMAHPPVQGQPFVTGEGTVHQPDGTPFEGPKKPRGRPKKDAVEAPATQAPFMAAGGNGTTLGQVPPATSSSPQAAPDEVEDIPPFLKRLESAPGMQPAAPPKPAGPSFGMQAAAAAPDDMQARIAAVLGMKT